MRSKRVSEAKRGRWRSLRRLREDRSIMAASVLGEGKVEKCSDPSLAERLG
jgi:hypothetical protein